MDLFFQELLGAIFQLCIFSLIPFIWWMFTERKHNHFFNWIGLKKIEHEKNIWSTISITTVATVAYIVLIFLCTKIVEVELTTAGSQFSGQGIMAVPAVLVYGFIRTGLSEEIVFRGFY